MSSSVSTVPVFPLSPADQDPETMITTEPVKENAKLVVMPVFPSGVVNGLVVTETVMVLLALKRTPESFAGAASVASSDITPASLSS
ncbi:MAG: hypothetical protein WCO86_11720, partial [Planctomycetota bacterium]